MYFYSSAKETLLKF